MQWTKLTQIEVDYLVQLGTERTKGKPYKNNARGIDGTSKHVAGIIGEYAIAKLTGGKMDTEVYGSKGDGGAPDITLERTGLDGNKRKIGILVKSLVNPDLMNVFIPEYAILKNSGDRDNVYVAAVRVDILRMQYCIEGFCLLDKFIRLSTRNDKHYHKAETIPGVKMERDVCYVLHLKHFDRVSV